MKKAVYVFIVILLFGLTTSISFAQDPSTRYSRSQANWTDADWEAEKEVTSEEYVNLKRSMWAEDKRKVAEQKAAKEANAKALAEYDNNNSKGNVISKFIPCTKKAPNDPQTNPNISGLNCNTYQEFIEIIQQFVNYSFIVATMLATISFTFAGWLYLTSRGDTAKIQRAHKIFLNVLKGFIFMALAYLLVKTILVGIAKSDYIKLQ